MGYDGTVAFVDGMAEGASDGAITTDALMATAFLQGHQEIAIETRHWAVGAFKLFMDLHFTRGQPRSTPAFGLLLGK